MATRLARADFMWKPDTKPVSLDFFWGAPTGYRASLAQQDFFQALLDIPGIKAAYTMNSPVQTPRICFSDSWKAPATSSAWESKDFLRPARGSTTSLTEDGAGLSPLRFEGGAWWRFLGSVVRSLKCGRPYSVFLSNTPLADPAGSQLYQGFPNGTPGGKNTWKVMANTRCIYRGWKQFQ